MTTSENMKQELKDITALQELIAEAVAQEGEALEKVSAALDGQVLTNVLELVESLKGLNGDIKAQSQAFVRVDNNQELIKGKIDEAVKELERVAETLVSNDVTYQTIQEQVSSIGEKTNEIRDSILLELANAVGEQKEAIQALTPDINKVTEKIEEANRANQLKDIEERMVAIIEKIDAFQKDADVQDAKFFERVDQVSKNFDTATSAIEALNDSTMELNTSINVLSSRMEVLDVKLTAFAGQPLTETLEKSL